jgi:hypothetical protein
VSNPELLIVCQPLVGEALAVRTTGFASVADALVAIERAIDEHRSLTLRREDSEASATPDGDVVVINMTVMMSVRVAPPSGFSDPGQYL